MDYNVELYAKINLYLPSCFVVTFEIITELKL